MHDLKPYLTLPTPKQIYLFNTEPPPPKKKTKAKKCLSTPPPIPQVIPLLNLFSFQFLESSIYLATPPTCPNVSLHQFVFFFLSGEESAKHQL